MNCFDLHDQQTAHTILSLNSARIVKAHLDKEKQLFAQGIKVLSLFFIDEVVKYRDYAQPDEKGEYARVFEEEYELLKEESNLSFCLLVTTFSCYTTMRLN